MRKYQPPEFAHGPRAKHIAHVQGPRRTGAAGPHDDARTGRIRERGATRRAAIRASQREH